MFISAFSIIIDQVIFSFFICVQELSNAISSAAD